MLLVYRCRAARSGSRRCGSVAWPLGSTQIQSVPGVALSDRLSRLGTLTPLYRAVGWEIIAIAAARETSLGWLRLGSGAEHTPNLNEGPPPARPRLNAQHRARCTTRSPAGRFAIYSSYYRPVVRCCYTHGARMPRVRRRRLLKVMEGQEEYGYVIELIHTRTISSQK